MGLLRRLGRSLLAPVAAGLVLERWLPLPSRCWSGGLAVVGFRRAARLWSGGLAVVVGRAPLSYAPCGGGPLFLVLLGGSGVWSVFFVLPWRLVCLVVSGGYWHS